jgi:cation diffusion facilitator family transporter
MSHTTTLHDPALSPRRKTLQLALRLAGITVAWNVIEGVIAVTAGAEAGSIALLGFGIDSFIETASAAVVGLRLYQEWQGRSPEALERIEKRASRIAGALLLALAAYVLLDSLRRLYVGAEAGESMLGVALTAVSLIVMPVLGRAKLRAAAELNSRALRADAYETITCAWLSLTTLLGLTANAAFGWHWADPIAALVLVPLIVREGLESVRAQGCHCHD